MTVPQPPQTIELASPGGNCEAAPAALSPVAWSWRGSFGSSIVGGRSLRQGARLADLERPNRERRWPRRGVREERPRLPPDPSCAAWAAWP